MAPQPKTGYARNGDVRIAYQVVGDGPFDLVMTPGYVSHLDLWWMVPETTAFLRRLASFSRLILYDKRGTGLSDPAPGLPALEERMEDVHAVLDAVGSERAAMLGISEGGPMSILFAATYPERTRALAIFGSFACYRSDDDYFPELAGRAAENLRHLDDIHDEWGSGRTLELFAPSVELDAVTRRSIGLYERLACSPGMAKALIDAAFHIDVRHILPAVRVPTLVVHRANEIAVPIEFGRYIAKHIPNARFVELPGDEHLPWLGDRDGLLDEIEEFLTGSRHAQPSERALATVLFTDIVASTERAAALGDQRWRALLERHDDLVRREVTAHGGREVKSLGDGFLLAFDGPARAIRCGLGILAEARELGLEVRAGVHTGECEIRGEDLGGMAVHIGARIAGMAAPGELLASSAVRDLVIGSGIGFADRGTHELKGVPGQWQLLAIEGQETATVPVAGTPRDERMPNAEIIRPGDRAVARLAATAPAVGRAVSHVTAFRARRRARGARAS
jgi:class 3 adenylate cyclase